ncbi:hypothetical protein [uncultured Draconibacterium sp.]|uniref:hypothetical protein n=1 Tax=uncultured Draconibacterium sp. TaxID=1573823 RepID=UPI0025E40BDF|nr:hypothetical protein [uncultured Draconibacterium sp.]
MNINSPFSADFEAQNDKDSKSFFCMELVWFITENDADYEAEFAKAKTGECSYKFQCEIYKRTMKRHQAVQQKLEF